MKKIYLVTGASGHLGSTLLNRLLEKGQTVRCFVLPGEEKYLPDGVEVFVGDVCDKASLFPFFQNENGDELILLHCAGIVTISSKKNPLVRKVNVEGTRNVLELALAAKTGRVVYVSSVHALLEADKADTKEADHFEPWKIDDPYGKSKAEASNLALEYARKGLNISIVHPTGIIGPGDIRNTNHSVRSFKAMMKGYIPVGLKGGFDFVDVRDVAEGIILCADKGKQGDCYILGGHYVKISELLKQINQLCGRRTLNIELPYGLVKTAAPLAEKFCDLFKIRSLITPYSIAILNGNGHFSHEKAKIELGYEARPIRDTLKDMYAEVKRR